MVAPVSSRSQIRTAQRARATGAAATAFASVGSSDATATASSASAACGAQLSLPAQHGHDIAPGQIVEQRQQLVADPHPLNDGSWFIGSSIGVELKRGARVVRLVPPQIEQRAAHGRRGAFR